MDKELGRVDLAPNTIREQRVQDAISILNRDNLPGVRSLINVDAVSGKREVILGVTGVQSGTVETTEGDISVSRVPESNPHNGSVIVDLRNSSLRGTLERKDRVREIAVGEDGIGAMQINKRTMLWVSVSPLSPEGDIPQS